MILTNDFKVFAASGAGENSDERLPDLLASSLRAFVLFIHCFSHRRAMAKTRNAVGCGSDRVRSLCVTVNYIKANGFQDKH